jgi:hypothetical protein
MAISAVPPKFMLTPTSMLSVPAASSSGRR